MGRGRVKITPNQGNVPALYPHSNMKGQGNRAQQTVGGAL